MDHFFSVRTHSNGISFLAAVAPQIFRLAARTFLSVRRKANMGTQIKTGVGCAD